MGEPPWPSAPFAMGTNLTSAPEMAAAMKAFIARGSAPRHASFMGAIGVGKAVAGWGLRLPVAPIGVFLAFFAAAGLAFAAGTGAAGAGAWAGACLGGGAGLAGAEVLGDAGSDLLEALLPIDMRTGGPPSAGTSSRRNSAGGHSVQVPNSLRSRVQHRGVVSPASGPHFEAREAHER